MKIKAAELKLLSSCSAKQLLNYRVKNQFHLQPWEPLRYPDGPSIQDCDLMIKAAKRNYEDGAGVSYCLVSEDQIIGLTNFSSISGSPFCACYLGFSIDGDLEGQGFARQMLIEAINQIFIDQSLNRIMANYMPRNIRSARLLHGIGFTLEGFAYDYLKINGQWEDHFLTSLLRREWIAKKTEHASLGV